LKSEPEFLQKPSWGGQPARRRPAPSPLLTQCILLSIQCGTMNPVTLTIDWAAAEPVYEQIARQVRAHIAAGDLTPGSPLPSVRSLASDLGVNLNTVARAYRLLEEEGFVKIRNRAGVEVAAPALKPDAAARDRLRSELRDLLVRMRQAGIARDETLKLVEHEIASLATARGADGGNHR